MDVQVRYSKFEYQENILIEIQLGPIAKNTTARPPAAVN